jgi:hypothetical protein
LTADGTTNRTGAFITDSTAVFAEIIGGTVINPGYRTGSLISCVAPKKLDVSGFDFSGFTNATTPSIVSATTAGRVVISNCKMAATWTPIATGARSPMELSFHNCGSADAATGLRHYTRNGDVTSSAAIYRSSGATVETEATSWLVTTAANCNEYDPYKSPYLYGLVSSTGSKAFDVYITNDTADFTDAEVWLEVEYLGTENVAQCTLASDQRADITTTAAAQTDDATSTWNGTGPAFTYKQSLAVTATIGETGQFRARVAIGKASIAGSSYLYVDPKVTVT